MPMNTKSHLTRRSPPKRPRTFGLSAPRGGVNNLIAQNGSRYSIGLGWSQRWLSRLTQPVRRRGGGDGDLPLPASLPELL